MNQWLVKISLFINYFVFAILLNSVGTVILQVQNSYGVSAAQASVLEAFKDLPIAITSFLVASFLTRIGYKRSMQIALALVAAASLLMPQLPTFWMTKALFAATERAVSAGVFGAPTWIVDGKELYWGQDRIVLVEHALRAG